MPLMQAKSSKASSYSVLRRNMLHKKSPPQVDCCNLHGQLQQHELVFYNAHVVRRIVYNIMVRSMTMSSRYDYITGKALAIFVLGHLGARGDSTEPCSLEQL